MMRHPPILSGLCLCLTLALGACGSDYVVEVEDPPTPRPPAPADSAYGEAPDWASCFGGYHSQYFNLPEGHAALEPPEGEDPIGQVTDPQTLDLWSEPYLAFERYDAALDPGPNWWPLDEGLAGDPAYFALRALAWVRAEDALSWQVRVGAADDVWILIDRKVALARPGAGGFSPEVVEIPLKAGQYPLEIFFANRRAAESALSVRSLSGEGVQICYPSFE